MQTVRAVLCEFIWPVDVQLPVIGEAFENIQSNAAVGAFTAQEGSPIAENEATQTTNIRRSALAARRKPSDVTYEVSSLPPTILEIVIEALGNAWVISLASSMIVALLCRRLWRKKQSASIDLATRLFTLLNVDVENCVGQIKSCTVQLIGLSSVPSTARNAADAEVWEAIRAAIDGTLTLLNPLVAALTVANEELDDLKDTVDELRESLEGWKQRIADLDSSADRTAVQLGYLRIDLLIANGELRVLLDAAKGDAARLLPGGRVGWLAKLGCLLNAVRKQLKKFNADVHKEYRSGLQWKALSKIKKNQEKKRRD